MGLFDWSEALKSLFGWKDNHEVVVQSGKSDDWYSYTPQVVQTGTGGGTKTALVADFPLESEVVVEQQTNTSKSRRGKNRKYSDEYLLEKAYLVKCMVGSYPRWDSRTMPRYWAAKWRKAAMAVGMPPTNTYTGRFGRTAIAWERAEEWGRKYEESLAHEQANVSSSADLLESADSRGDCGDR